MTPDHVRYAEWDAAYVVRALSSVDRLEYEAHLDECPLCRAAIGDLAPTLGLLARVPAERAESLLAPEPETGHDPAARARLVARAAAEARRRRVVTWAVGIAAAAALALVVGFGVTMNLAPPSRAGEVVALEPVAGVPLTATVELTPVSWGTRIAMECRYAASDDAGAPDREWPYVLVVIAADGTTSELSSWRAAPGTTARLDAGTALDPDEIAAIEVRSPSGDRVLLRGAPTGR